MGASAIFPYAPNTAQIKDVFNGTTWFLLASDGNGYASVAALVAAVKKPWPALDPGMFIQTLSLDSESAANTDGSLFYFAVNRATAPTDPTGEKVSGSGQVFTIAGPLYNLWLRKTTATDLINVFAKY